MNGVLEFKLLMILLSLVGGRTGNEDRRDRDTASCLIAVAQALIFDADSSKREP